MSPLRPALFAALVLSCPVSGALAAERQIYTYDAASDAARTLTQTGLSFEFEKGLLGGARVRRIIQTGEFGAAELKPSSDAALGPGGLRAALGPERPVGPLYEILPSGEGRSFVHAVCPGAERAWLLIGPLDRFRDLTVEAVGRTSPDPAAHHCSTLQFSFRSDLRLPGSDVPDARLLGRGRP